MKQGIYFRATDDQVDPTDYDAEVSTTANYPRTSAQGFSVGWESAVTGTRDRTTTGDVRLRGIHFVDNSGSCGYRIELPSAGTYSIRVAMGDPSGPQACRVDFFDSVTRFVSLNSDIAADHYMDASGVVRTSVSDWVTNNAPIIHTFGTSTFRAVVGASTHTVSFNSTIAALYIETAAAGGFFARRYYDMIGKAA